MPAIEVQGLAKAYGGRPAVDALSFSVQAGEVFGLLGPNGAGKTTTLRMLAGLLAPDRGSARVAGEWVRAGEAGGPALRRKVGLLTEQPGFYERLDLRTNLVYFGRLYGLSRPEATTRAGSLLRRVGLWDRAGQPFSTLSRGMKQKLAIARALLHRPEVLLLDEPTVGLDPEATREVRALVAEVAAEGRTVVLCTHHLDEVERMCGRAAFLAGRIVGIHDLSPGDGRRVVVELAAASEAVLGAVRALEGVETVARSGTSLEVALASTSLVPEVVAAVVGAGGRVLAVQPARRLLEEAWLELLGRARQEGLVP